MQSEAAGYKQGAPQPSIKGQCCLWSRMFWAFVCCFLPGQTKHVKVGVFWGWTAITVTSTAMFVRLAIFGLDYATSSPGDMRQVHKVTNIMCKGITITNEQEDNVAVYSMLGEPPINPNKKFQSFKRNKEVDTYDDALYWNFYLLTGSEMKITTTVDTAVELTILQGKEKLDKFLGKKKEKCNNNCHLQEHLYTTGTHFTDITTSTTDDYYFLYRRTDRSVSAQPSAESSNIDVTFNLNRTVYDLSNATSVCTLSTGQGQTSSCYIELPLTDDLRAVMSYDEMSNAEAIKVITECDARVGFYILFFLAIPLVCGGIITGLMMLFCKDNKQMSFKNNVGSDKNSQTKY